MSLARKLLGAWLVGKTASNATSLILRLLLSMVAITALAIVVAMVVAMLMAGLLWLAYLEMTLNGITSQHAILILGAFLLVLCAAAILQLRHYWHRAQRISMRLMYLHIPLSTHISSVANAFISGLTHPRSE